MAGAGGRWTIRRRTVTSTAGQRTAGAASNPAAQNWPGPVDAAPPPAGLYAPAAAATASQCSELRSAAGGAGDVPGDVLLPARLSVRSLQVSRRDLNRKEPGV